MEELERRFFYALMSRSRGKESLVSWGFTGAVLTGQGKYTETLKNAVLLRDKSTAKEWWSYGSFPHGTKQELYRHEQPPPTQQGTDLKGKGLVVANAVLAGGLGLYPCGLIHMVLLRAYCIKVRGRDLLDDPVSVRNIPVSYTHLDHVFFCFRYRLAVQNFYFNLFNWYVPPLQSLSVRTDS